MLAAPAIGLRGQGILTRNVSPTPRGKPSGLPFHAHFTDIADAAGLHAPVICGDDDHKSYILETVGCGAAFLDYDNDGWLDIFVLSGTRLEGSPGATNRLYRNNRDGTFTDVTEKAGLRRTGWASAVTVGDYNNDGFDDLFVTYWGQNVLYRNNGDGTFRDVTKEAGLLHTATRWGSGCAFLDYDRDGHLDLFVANYLDFRIDAIPKPGSNSNCNWKGIPVMCGPRGLPPGVRALYHNNGDGTFTDVSVPSGIAKAQGSYMMTAVAADFDNDGWPDIYVACDSTPSFLLRNNHDGTFTDIGLQCGVALNEDGNEQAGMGVGIGDFNLDGSLDILKTHFADDTSVLYRNTGKDYFEDVTITQRPGSGDAFRRMGQRNRGPGQRRESGPVPCYRWCVSRDRGQSLQLSPAHAARHLSQFGKREVRGVDRKGGSGNRRAALQPRVRVRRFRQRRRHGRSGDQPERGAVAAAQ